MADAIKADIMGVAKELMRIFPDSIIVGSGVFALFLQSFPYFVFFASMLEAKLLFSILAFTFSYLNIAPGIALPKSYSRECRSGFTDVATPLALSMFKPNQQNEFPSEQIYMLSTAGSYIFSSLNALGEELQMLGPQFSSRYYASVILLVFLMFGFAVFRISCSCETFGTVMMTIPIGLIVGYALVQQNTRLISRNSVNMIGVPLLASKAANGQPIYVCPK